MAEFPPNNTTQIFEELGIPKKYLRPTDRDDRLIALVHRQWLKSLVKHRKLTDFIERPRFESWPCTDDEIGPQWLKVFVCVYRKREAKVLPLPKVKHNLKEDPPLMLPQLLQYISQTNFKNSWKDAYKKYCDGGDSTKDIPVILCDYNRILRDVVSRTYGCHIVNVCNTSEGVDEEFEAGGNLLPAVCGVETLNAVFLFHIPFIEHTLNDCVNFSPAVLEKCYAKPLFVVYQLLQSLKFLHNRSLTLGDITLNDVYVTDDLWLQLFPQLSSNLSVIQLPTVENKKSINFIDCRKNGHKYNSSLKCENCGIKTYDKYQVTNENLETLCKLWVQNQISNYTYLTALNNFSGRKLGDPNRHHVFPWVTDFTTRSGKNWRDLKKSKYRLNKGDNQLDLQYESSQTQVPHHVSDVLSAITYYVYTARRTPKSVLCKYVRPVWVPAEYPASMRRLQEWTPDECVPEFYCDPGVFRSIHDDLDDLEVPAWSSSPEDFVEGHREMLESTHVSERLHHWIDLTFGYKLHGNVAVKAKNVCLHLVDDHTHLTKSGIIQLFQHPHPPKIINNVYWWKAPPKYLLPKPDNHTHNTRDRSNSSIPSVGTSKSDEDNADVSVGASMGRSPLVLSKLLSRSRSSLNEDSPMQKSRSPSSQRSGKVSKSKSGSIKDNGSVVLYKDYKPEALLESYEKLHGFLAKVFHTEESVKFKECLQIEDVATNAREEIIQNAFTNRFFSENFDARLKRRIATKSLTFPIDQGSLPYSKRLQSHNENQITCNYKEIISSRRTKELQTVGCLLVEIFLHKHIRCLIRSNSTKTSFNERLKACITVANSCSQDLPICVKHLVQLLLQPNSIITDIGLPPPNAHQLLEPILQQTINFPKHFLNLYSMLTSLKRFEVVANELELLYYFECDGKACSTFRNVERMKMLFAQNIGECSVKLCSRNIEMLQPQLDTTTDNKIVYILLPYIKNLIEQPSTSILAAWYLFEPFSRFLGPRQSRIELLESMLRLYEGDLVDSNAYFGNKVIKLYHHSFLLVLIVRLGLRCFLENFITPLVEAVGGYRDNESGDFVFHNHSERLVRKTSHLKSMATEEKEDLPESTHKPCKATTSLENQPEEVFALDLDEPQSTMKSVIAHLELNVDSDLHLDHSTAEEAIDATNYEPQSNVAGSIGSLEEGYGDDVGSIPIPSKEFELCNISCDVGSKSDSEYLPDRHSNMSHFDVENESCKSGSSGPTVMDSSRTSNQSNKKETKISDMSADSLIWMSHRLGPVLTARHITRNLLKMLTLCYVGKENLQPISIESDDIISIANSGVIGDRNASKVLNCLSTIAALYGEQLILLQYLPHMSELISLCKKKITANLEGGLVSCLALLKYVVPFLSDSSLMDHLQDVIIKNILNPVIRLLGSTKYTFPSGAAAREVLARKYLDTVYILSVRLGATMTKTQLAVPSLQRFFFVFEKIHNSEAFHVDNNAIPTSQQENNAKKALEESNFVELLRDGTTTEWAVGGKPVQISHVKFKDADSFDSLSPPVNADTEDNSTRSQIMEELKSVFTPQLAYTAYMPFLKHLGPEALDVSLRNHDTIQSLCKEHLKKSTIPEPSTSQTKNIPRTSDSSPPPPDATPKPSTSYTSNTSVIGNRIDIQDDTSAGGERDMRDVLKLVSGRMAGGSRNLRGNWLAYWEHEIGRSEKDVRFNFKQIRLQIFGGHSQSVKALYVLDNENSFISGSRDKTVKLWSLRSQGDGNAVCGSQWTYTAHRKSILSLTFVESMRLAVSCDSIVHIWDPFMGVNVGYLESPRYSPVNILTSMPAPSTQFLAATTEGMIRIVDARTCSYVYDLKVSHSNASLIRCLTVSPSGLWVAAGLSTGNITVLDTRTGLVLSTWVAHEGGVLQLVAVDERTIISSSLDQTVSVWNVDDGKLKFNVSFCVPRGTYDPVHCLATYNGELISGTTGNRIGVHTSIEPDASFSTTKLRADTFKGLLISMAVLPLNRLLLLGADNGTISLLC